MPRIFHLRLLAIMAVLAVLGGIQHQVLHRFERHQHCAQPAGDCTGHEAPDEDGGCNHLVCHHQILALVDSPTAPLFLALELVGRVDHLAQRITAAEPAEVEHPPQLA